MTALLRLLLEQGVAINVVPVDGKWCEVDSEHDLKEKGARLELILPASNIITAMLLDWSYF